MKDYIRSRFRLDALREPRPLVFADLMAVALKRAPRKLPSLPTRATIKLREWFPIHSQRVPRRLFESLSLLNSTKAPRRRILPRYWS